MNNKVCIVYTCVFISNTCPQFSVKLHRALITTHNRFCCVTLKFIFSTQKYTRKTFYTLHLENILGTIMKVIFNLNDKSG